jgi:solute carrier family 35 protein E3
LHLYAKRFQTKESEADPLLGMENGTGMLGEDGVGPNVPEWNSNKDLHA